MGAAMDQVDEGVLSDNTHTEYSLSETGLPLLETSAPTQASTTLVAWIRLCRPPTLSLGLAPVLVTLAYLWATGAPLLALPLLGILISTSSVLAGASMLDEYLEYERKVHRRHLEDNGGGYYAKNVLEGTGIRPMSAFRVSIGLLGFGVVVGLPLIKIGGLPLLVLGALGLAVAILYSSTNFALKQLPIGELAVFLALGPGLSVATMLSQDRRPTLPALELGLALGLFTLALVLAAHLRDQESDRAISRRTLIQQSGNRAGSILYTACLAIAYLLVILVALPRGATHGAVLALFSLPATLIAWTGVCHAVVQSSRHLAVRHTLRAYARFAFWTFTGLLVGGLIVRLVALLQG
jgi:1,4-dihydroxy-2-naphthoate polyprenyltransferase